ncbi:MAG: DUF4428 domain-containing protein [Lachnospiraceae bacterium]|nr:DUF4428 domain-containing protein [Lachnospiraceae bacterium]
MGLFDKKYCDICGEKIGFLGNRKLADGNMCKQCAEQMSPWLEGRKEYTVAEMQQHIAYRQANYEEVKHFQVTDVLGYDNYRLYINRYNNTWFISSYKNYTDSNPDILYFSQVTGCEMEIKETHRELYAHTPDNRTVPYNPREYDYDYDFYINIYLVDFVTNVVRIKLNTFRVEDAYDPKYKELENLLYNMKTVFDQMAQGYDGSNLVIPEQLVIDAVTRMDMERQARFYRDAQRDRMRAFEMMLANPGAPAPRPMTPPRPVNPPRPTSPQPPRPVTPQPTRPVNSPRPVTPNQNRPTGAGPNRPGPGAPRR